MIHILLETANFLILKQKDLCFCFNVSDEWTDACLIVTFNRTKLLVDIQILPPSYSFYPFDYFLFNPSSYLQPTPLSLPPHLSSLTPLCSHFYFSVLVGHWYPSGPVYSITQIVVLHIFNLLFVLFYSKLKIIKKTCKSSTTF